MSDRSPAGLRVALVHDWLTGMRGGEKVLEAIAELFPGAPIYTLLHLPGSVSPELEAHPIHTSFLQGWPGSARHYRRYLPFFPAAIEDFDLSSYDLILSSSHCVAKGVIPGPGARHLCYCHTPMRYAWDQEHVYFPRRHGWTARLRNLALSGLRTWDVASAPRVDAFFANSHFVARRIERYYGREAEVLPPPVEVEFFTGGGETVPKAESPYALMVSALAPYKRVDLAIEACRDLELDLKVVGSGPEKSRLARMAGPRVEFCGRVEAEELRRLYRQAALFVQPGVEDFGIAAVEALASGTPVVALGRGGVRDIVENGVHGWLYDIDDVTELRQAIDKCLRIRFNKLDLAERAQAFSRSRFKERFRALAARWVAELEVSSR